MTRNFIGATTAVFTLCLGLVSGPVFAELPGTRTGLGQDAPKDGPMLSNLRLTDPLVQKKYLNEPDMLRFLRATYSEACARGLLVDAVKQITADTKHEYAPDTKNMIAKLTQSNRLWKMSSFEMETLFGSSYLHSANYCDCLLKEVADTELVNPRKGLEVIMKLPKKLQATCERLSKEQTEAQLANYKKQKP